MDEMAKPSELATRGGSWFRVGAAEIRHGVENDFTPARKAHPTLEVEDLEVLRARLDEWRTAHTGRSVPRARALLRERSLRQPDRDPWARAVGVRLGHMVRCRSRRTRKDQFRRLFGHKAEVRPGMCGGRTRTAFKP